MDIFYLKFMFLCLLKLVYSKIHEITASNIQKLQNEEKFMMIYVTKSDSLECRLAYPKFVEASQPFDSSDGVMFGRIQHVGLASNLDVETFPTLIYFKANSKTPSRANIDITVESIIQFISDVTRKDFIYMDKHFTVELTQANFDEITQTPHQFKLMLMYSNENKDKVEWFDDLAQLYKNDDKIVFCRLDIHREGNLRGRFQAKKFPALYWFSDDEIPQKSLYGGRFDKVEMMAFITDKTIIRRLPDGSLPENAGVLKDMDELVNKYKNTIASGKNMKGVIDKAREYAKHYDDKEIPEYYLYLLEEIEWHGETSIIDDERYYFIRELANDNGPKRKELLLKKQNVVRSFIDILGSKLLKRNSKQSPIVMAKQPRPHKHSHEAIHRHEEL